tara:strand:+ start:181 stop:666 length:486 start_codon:yes stop_codon:yes gene_type:complete
MIIDSHCHLLAGRYDVPVNEVIESCFAENISLLLNIATKESEFNEILDISRKPHIKYYSSDRISQYMGNGSCVFIDINSGLNELFNDNEAVFFDSYDLDEFQRKILYYVENIQETRSIAKKGWEKGHSNYNERIVTEYFIDIAFNKIPTKEYSWPIHQFFL